MKVDGSVALVTGANRGLGAAIVDALLATGARRVYAGVRRPLDYTSVLPKLAPGVVASRIIEALENEIEDVYPGEASTIVERLRAEPKAVERQFARMFPVSATSRGGPSPDEEREPNQHAE
jgi:NAD(P)-dependent dehydrogenase (short-subunit alcohol dehydrogenase family)